MPDAPATGKKKKGFFQRAASVLKDFVEWVEETFSDGGLSAEIRDDLGLDPANPATPAVPDPARRARIEQFAAAEDVDEASLAAVAVDLKAEVDAVLDFIAAARADQVDARVLFSTMFRMFALDLLRVRNPGAHALVKVAGLVLDDEETVAQLDAAALMRLVRGDGTTADGEAWVQRLTMGGGVTLIVLLATALDDLKAVFDASYGWDPDPEDEGESAAIASRALTMTLSHELLGGVRPAITIIPVPSGHGGPGIFTSFSTGFTLPMDVGDTRYLMEVAGTGQFGVFVALDRWEVRSLASFAPSVRFAVEPKPGERGPQDRPAFVVGTTDGSRLEVGALAFGLEMNGERAGFRVGVRKGKLVVSLGEGDAFLRQLPGGDVVVPFELGLVASTDGGIRFEGGTGARVNLPVSASLFGVFTVQFLEVELVVEPELMLELRGGFSLQLGAFAASIDRVGVRLALHRLGDGIEELGDLVQFAPPKGIGLVLDAGAVKGGGYLFVDAARGEYAGALELRFLTWSIKAIGLLSTRRPDGTEGWSLLLFVFGQFHWHLGFGIFWTGLGGMVGLHHRADVDALSAGMRTGALDDVLFPRNPVADAPRIVNRYRTLFPVAEGNFLVGPVLELSFSDPPMVYVRLGVIVDVRNALGAGPAALSKVVLVGQVLVQLPPRDTGAPAILKLLVDVVGFYDADARFLLVRARLRDSFVGIEGFVKLDLAGELLVAVQFGPKAAFVLSAGGFHPKYQGLPERVPRDLDRLRVSFKLGPVSLAVEHYFAVTPNSVQAGQRTVVKAKFGVAGIEASLSWDALLYLSPRFCFVVDLEFRAKVKAFGETLASVGVNATLEGPDEWHFFGSFSFSILWWDKTVRFDERWGEVRTAEVASASLSEVLRAELANPDNVTIEAPVGGASPVTLAPAGAVRLAHPLGRLAIRQRAVPFGLRVERLGTRPVAGGAQTVTIEAAALNGRPLPSFEPTTEAYSRGQFVDLTDDEKLTGPTFEPFPSGVIVGSAQYVAPDDLARDVAAGFETVRLDPEPQGLGPGWVTVPLAYVRAGHEGAMAASRVGAAARSGRAAAARRFDAPATVVAVAVDEPPLALVAEGSLAEAATLLGPAARSASLAGQVAAIGGQRVVERYEVVA